MSRHHQSREEWEQDFRDVQRNVLPHEDVRATSIIARRAAEEGSALIRGPKQLVLLVLAMLSFGIAVALWSLPFSNREWLHGVSGLVALAAAVLLILLALRDRRPGNLSHQSKD